MQFSYIHPCHRRKSIALMSVSKESNITVQKTLTTSFGCSTISPLEADTFVTSTANHLRHVRTITVQGKEGDIQHRLLPDNTYTVYDSTCTYLPSTNTLVFVDKYQHTVYMCSITSGEGHVIKHDIIQRPVGVCAGPAGTVFVCSEDTDSVVQLSAGGKILMSHDVGMKFPKAVSLSSDGTRLAMSNSHTENEKVKLFEVSS